MRILRRAGFFALSAVIAFVGLYAAGFNPVEWFAVSKQHTSAVSKKVARSVPAQARPAGNAVPRALQPLAGTDSSISPKPLALLLSGTSPGPTAFEGTATIGVRRENAQTYAAGGLLANGARLREIHSDFVVLERKGQTAKLYLQDGDSAQVSNTGTSTLLTVGGQQVAQTASATHVEKFTDYLRPSPVYDGAVISGYEVYPGSKAAVFTLMGLQAGDIITAIEGAPLADAAQTFEMLRQLTDGAVLNATIRRRGRLESVELDGGLIAAEQERELIRAAGR